MKKSSQAEARELMALPCACANLRRAARAVTQLYAREMKQSGIEPAQLGLLLVMSASGEMTQGQLGDRLTIDSTTLTRTLAPLRANGWITSKQGADRRELLWRITPAGQRQLKKARPHWDRAQKKLREKLGEKDWNLLQTTLPRAAQAAQEI